MRNFNIKEYIIKNQELFIEANTFIPGGVNSPVRSFKGVGGVPFFTKSAKDCYLFDVEDNKYIDYVCSWGASIAGHAHDEIVKNISEALQRGFSYGTPTHLETTLAKSICELIPSMEKVRLVSSGTEGVMSAIRLSRAYTKRDYILKFNGCYHGHTDSMLVSAGSGAMYTSSSGSDGVLSDVVSHTLVIEYNDINQLQQVFELYRHKIAAVIFEPFAANMNLVFPTEDFITQLQQITKEHGTLLICDEVITGFRVGLHGAQHILNIKPDITILGKIIGGGLPLAAFGGTSHIMDLLAPLGTVYQAGTLSGNPIAVTAGISTLDIIKREGFYDNLSHITNTLANGLMKSARIYDVPLIINHIGGLFGLHFQGQLPQNLLEVKKQDSELFKKFFHKCLSYGVFFAPALFESGFVSMAHTDEVINNTINICEKVFKEIKS